MTNDRQKLLAAPLVDAYRESHTVRVAAARPALLIMADLSHRPSQVYVGRKEAYCRQVGVKVEVVDLSQTARLAAQDIVKYTQAQGVLVQVPVPPEHRNLQMYVPPWVDVEGFDPSELGRLVVGKQKVSPCTASAVIDLLTYYGFDFVGARVCVVNDSVVLGKPLALLLNHRRATTILCNKYTRDLPAMTRSADVVVTAVGQPDFSLTADMIADGVWVVDAGVRPVAGGTAGDLEPGAEAKCARWTPHRGGVGPVTVAWVVENLLRLIEKPAHRANAA